MHWEKQTDKQTDRGTEKQTEKHSDIHTERQTNRRINRQNRDCQTDRIDKLTHRLIDGNTLEK